ncbi:MAG: ferritin family protein, partial [Bauldia litoralis]
MSGQGDSATSREPATAITSVQELMSYAVTLEVEAERRYEDLADQMEVHNNIDVATLFRTLARYEADHARRLDVEAAKFGAGELPAGQGVWAD